MHAIVSHSDRLPLVAAAKELNVHIGTLNRWAFRGVRGGIRLETWLLGGRRYTTRAAIDSFLSELNGQPTCSASEPAKAHTEAERRMCERRKTATT